MKIKVLEKYNIKEVPKYPEELQHNVVNIRKNLETRGNQSPYFIS